MREGAGTLSLRAVAAEAGYAPASIYEYFRNRAEMILALAADDLGQIAHALREHPAQTDAKRSGALGAAAATVLDPICHSGALAAAVATLESAKAPPKAERVFNGKLIGLLTALADSAGRTPLKTREEQADVVLAVGTRFLIGPLGAQMEVPAEQRLIQIDIDPEEVGRNRTPDPAVLGDARQALGELVRRVPRHNRSRDSREQELSALKRAAAEQLSAIDVQAGYAMAVREALPDDGIWVNESTQVGYWSTQGVPVYEPRGFVTSGYQGTLGYGFATALGAQVGNPERKVVSISGDGGFMYNLQELSTMARHQIPLVAVVFNDDAFGNVRRIQSVRFNDHVIASDLRNPDLVAVAESFGVAATRATNPKELTKALDHAFASNAPHLIEGPMPPTVDLSSTFPMEALPPRPVLDL